MPRQGYIDPGGAWGGDKTTAARYVRTALPVSLCRPGVALSRLEYGFGFTPETVVSCEACHALVEWQDIALLLNRFPERYWDTVCLGCSTVIVSASLKHLHEIWEM